jgi:hypothetical protein
MIGMYRTLNESMTLIKFLKNPLKLLELCTGHFSWLAWLARLISIRVLHWLYGARTPTGDCLKIWPLWQSWKSTITDSAKNTCQGLGLL